MIEGLSKDDTFLGLDIATRTGWAVLAGGGCDSGEKQFQRETRLSSFRDWLTEMIAEFRPAVIFTEQSFLNTNPSTRVLLYMRGVLLERMERCTAVHIDVDNSKVKAFVGGNGRMTAKQKKDGAMIRALAGHGYWAGGIDSADALAVALTGRHELLGCGLER